MESAELATDTHLVPIRLSSIAKDFCCIEVQDNKVIINTETKNVNIALKEYPVFILAPWGF
jgi:hypothetical protein